MVKIKTLEEGKQSTKEEGKQSTKEGEKGYRTSLRGKHRNGQAAKKRAFSN